MSAPPSSTFVIRGAFRPSRSLLGRWIRARSVDDRQAESTYVVVAVAASIGLVLLHILVWTLFAPSGGGDGFWTLVTAEIVLGTAVAAAAFVGWAPAISVRAAESRLVVARGRARPGADETGSPHRAKERDRGRLSMPYDAIDAVARVDARTFHRHYRRYAETRVFVNRIDEELLLLQWNGVPVVIGLTRGDLNTLERILTARAHVESSRVDAA